MSLLVVPRDVHSRIVVGTSMLMAVLTLVGSWIAAVDGTELLRERAVVFGVFVSLLFFLEVRPMATHRSSRMSTFSWTFAFTLMLVGPVHLALAANVVASAVGAVADSIAGRRASIATGFDGSRSTVSLFVAGVVGNTVGDLQTVAGGRDPELDWLVTVAVAQLAGLVMSSLLDGLARASHEGLPMWQSLIARLTDQLRTDGLLFGLAPVFAVVATNALILIPVLLLIVWVILHSATAALESRWEATIDGLTGIPNRRIFEAQGTMMLERVASRKSQAAVIHLDLDGFKAINDRLGHQYGDGVLKEIAHRLDSSQRSADLVARLGGDEFAVILTSVAGRSDAEAAASRILRQIEEPLRVDDVPLRVTASLGVALFPDDGDNLESVLHHADLAMYRAKTDAVGVSVYSAGSVTAPGRMSLVSELSTALEVGQLELHYQPKVDLRTGRIATVEALLRWRHPVHGMVNPGWFMPMAEQTDLMRDITDHVLRLALTQCADWRRRGIDVGVAVNASARNLHDYRFPNRIAGFLNDVGLDPSSLELEITENTIMEDPRRSAAVMAQLRALGVSVSIDDFGTGYSSLAALRSLTIDSIKIDRSFVTELAERNADLTIVRSVVELGRNLGLTTVAEGVETDEVLHIIRRLGVDEFQGYLACPPLPAKELEPILIHGALDLSGFQTPIELPVGRDRTTSSGSASMSRI